MRKIIKAEKNILKKLGVYLSIFAVFLSCNIAIVSATDQNIATSASSDETSYEVDIPSSFNVTIPKEIKLKKCSNLNILAKNQYENDYAVRLFDVDLRPTDVLYITSDSICNLTNGTLNTSAKNSFTYGKYTDTFDNYISSGTVSSTDITAGDWVGGLTFNVSLNSMKTNISKTDIYLSAGSSTKVTYSDIEGKEISSTDDFEVVCDNEDVTADNDGCISVSADANPGTANIDVFRYKNATNEDTDDDTTEAAENTQVTEAVETTESDESAEVSARHEATKTQTSLSKGLMLKTLKLKSTNSTKKEKSKIWVGRIKVTIVDVKNGSDSNEPTVLRGEENKIEITVSPLEVKDKLNWTIMDIDGNIYDEEDAKLEKAGDDYKLTLSMNIPYGSYVYLNGVCDEYHISLKYEVSETHEWEKTVVEPTCTEDGYTIYYCSKCGTTENHDTVEKTGHDFEVEKIEATCTGKGITQYTCKKCGYSKSQDEISPKGHTESDWIIDYDSTCTQTGLKHKVCTVCGATTQTEVIAAKGHTGNEGTGSVYQSVTCTSNGTRYARCTRCHCDYGTPYIYAYALGHNNAYGGSAYCHTYCTRCNVTTSSSHSYSTSQISTVSCTSNTVIRYTCACGYSYDVTTAYAYGHSASTSSAGAFYWTNKVVSGNNAVYWSSSSGSIRFYLYCSAGTWTDTLAYNYYGGGGGWGTSHNGAKARSQSYEGKASSAAYYSYCTRCNCNLSYLGSGTYKTKKPY